VEESREVRLFWAGIDISEELGERSFFSARRFEPGMVMDSSGRAAETKADRPF